MLRVEAIASSYQAKFVVIRPQNPLTASLGDALLLDIFVFP